MGPSTFANRTSQHLYLNLCICMYQLEYWKDYEHNTAKFCVKDNQIAFRQKKIFKY